MRRIAAMALCGWLAACLVGCKSPSMAAAPMTASAEGPKWVSMGARAFPEDAGKAFYGVGIAAANRFPDDLFMLRKTAAVRARDDLAGQLKTLISAVLKDYSAAAFTPGMKPAEMQSLTENVLKSVTDATLTGAKETDSWRDPQTGDMYMLVKLGLDEVAPQVRDQIIAVEKDKLKLDAAAAHKELDEIILNAERPLPKAK